jgi:hypothetical protein
MQKQPLTRTQRQYYDAIVSLNDAAGYFPTARAIAKARGRSLNPVHVALEQLVERGWIARAGKSGQTRAYRVVESAANASSDYVLLPDSTVQGQNGRVKTDGHRTMLSEEDHTGKRIHHRATQFTSGSRVVGYWTPAHLLEEKQ